MNKVCYNCGNDWCLNLFDDPINPEENLCDMCNHAPLNRRCPECSQSLRNRKNVVFTISWGLIIFFQIIIAFFIMMKLGFYFGP